MAEDTRITNWPKDGSAERVAFDLFTLIANREGWRDLDNRKQIITLFRECRAAVLHGSYDMSKLT